MLYTLLWYFVIYAFLGWCCEVAFAGIVENRFVNRGFLNGAVCPIYGFGICIVYVCLMPMKDTWFMLFFCSMVLTSLLELATGFALDKIFHQRWWDYSANKCNLGGYICLIASVGWGAGCIFVVKCLFPLTNSFIKIIPYTIGIIILAVMYVIFAVDVVITVCTMIGLNRYVRQLDDMSKAIREDSDKIGEQVSKGAIEVKKQYDEKLKDKYEDLAQAGEKVKNELAEKSSAMVNTIAKSQLGEKGSAVTKGIAQKGNEVKKELMEKGSAVKNEITERSKAIRDSFAESKKSKAEKKALYDKTVANGAKRYGRYFKAFPNMRFTDYQEQINAIRDRINRKH